MSIFSKELAEICGIHAGDGYLRNKDYRRELDISGGFDEESYYDEHVIPLFSKVFNITIEGKFFPYRRTYGFVIREKRVIEEMHNLGFPYGAKSSILRVPKFILESKNSDLKSAFLRGVFDTDGCIYFQSKVGKRYCEFKRTHKYYPTIILCTVANGFFEDLKKLLVDLKIQFWSDTKINGNKKRSQNWLPSHRIWMKGGRLVNDWMEKIGMKNYSKLSKYLIWKKYGHCPSYTTFSERLSILSGDITIDKEGPVWQPG